jgi:hypothetical protein
MMIRGDETDKMVAVEHSIVLLPLPVAPPEGEDALSVAFSREAYLDLYPRSDLAELLMGTKDFQIAVCQQFDR